MGEYCILGYFHSEGMENSLKTWNVTGVFDGRNHDISWGLRKADAGHSSAPKAALRSLDFPLCDNKKKKKESF